LVTGDNEDKGESDDWSCLPLAMLNVHLMYRIGILQLLSTIHNLTQAL
jgi:hypothetical protein